MIAYEQTKKGKQRQSKNIPNKQLVQKTLQIKSIAYDHVSIRVKFTSVYPQQMGYKIANIRTNHDMNVTIKIYSHQLNKMAIMEFISYRFYFLAVLNCFVRCWLFALTLTSHLHCPGMTGFQTFQHIQCICHHLLIAQRRERKKFATQCSNTITK